MRLPVFLFRTDPGLEELRKYKLSCGGRQLLRLTDSWIKQPNIWMHRVHYQLFTIVY